MDPQNLQGELFQAHYLSKETCPFKKKEKKKKNRKNISNLVYVGT